MAQGGSGIVLLSVVLLSSWQLPPSALEAQ